jgi:hypothetical protein
MIMTYDEAIQLFLGNCQHSAWTQVFNESGDGGFTSVCNQDIALTVSVNVIWKGRKPASSFQVRYGTTTLFWFEIPVVSSNDLETIFAAALPQIRSRLEKGA